MGGVLVASVLLLAACEPGAQPTPTPTPGEATPTPAEATPTPAEATPTPVEATPTPVAGEPLVVWADETRVSIFAEFGRQFEAEYGVPVVVEQVGFGDIRDRHILAAPAGEGADIIIGAHDWLGQLVSAGVIAPIDLGAKSDQFDPVGINAFTYEGRLYGMPYALEAIALYYNTDLVPEPPATWEELKQISADLQEQNLVEQGFCVMTADPTYHSYPILTGFGGYIFGQDEAGAYDPQDIGLDTPGGVAYAQELDQMTKDGLIRPNVDYGACLFMMTGERPEWLDPEAPDRGRAAFWITGPWALGDIEAAEVNFGVAPIPTMPETPRPFVGVQGMMISAFSEQQLLAQAFLTEFMATDAAMAELFDVGRRPPAWLPTAGTVTDPNILAFLESGTTGNPMPTIPEMSEVWGSWGDALQLIFNQQQDAEQAIRDAAESIRDSIGE